MDDDRLDRLAAEYAAVRDGMASGMRRRTTRRHKEGLARMLEILREAAGSGSAGELLAKVEQDRRRPVSGPGP